MQLSEFSTDVHVRRWSVEHYAIAAFVFCREVSSSGFEYLFVTKMWNKPLSPVLKTRRGPYHWLHAQNSGNIDKLSTRSCRDYAARCRDYAAKRLRMWTWHVCVLIPLPVLRVLINAYQIDNNCPLKRCQLLEMWSLLFIWISSLNVVSCWRSIPISPWGTFVSI